MSHETTISEKSKVTIGVVAVLAGGIFWLTTLHANTSENTKSVASLVKKEDEKDKVLTDILVRLAKIEGMLTPRENK